MVFHSAAEQQQSPAQSASFGVAWQFSTPRPAESLKTDSLQKKNFLQKMMAQNAVVKSLYGVGFFWTVLVGGYGIGILSFYPANSLPLFMIMSFIMIISFPLMLMLGGYKIYRHIGKTQQVNLQIIEAARMLSSPALNAASDVKTLASAIGEELSNLRYQLREIEDKLQNVHQNLAKDIETYQSFLETPTIYTPSSANVSVIETKTQAIQEEPVFIQNDTPPYVAQKTPPPQEINNSFEVDQQEIAEQTQKQLEHLWQQHYQQNPITERPQTTFQLKELQPLQESPEHYILRRERNIYNGLCALAVDLNRVLNTNPPQEFWSLYMGGDCIIFANYLCEWIHDNYEFYKEYVHDEKFRRTSQSFLSQFELLRERLFETPHPEVSEYLEQTALGKIYNILITEYVATS